MKKLILFLSMMSFSLSAASDPVAVSLEDYVFDFPAIGYEITVTGETKNYTDKLTADDYITINDAGYKLKTLIDRMDRKDRQQFIAFFNDHCIVGFGASGCTITASGDIELDEDMKMIFRMNMATISMSGVGWTNLEGE